MPRVTGVLLALVTAASAVAAQEPEPRFRAGVDLVALNVIATDSQGRPVKELSRTDFVVTEDGQRQDISVFAVVPAPIDLALLLDTSASMTDKIDTVKRAAIGFTSVVRAGDRISIVDIKDAIKILHPLNEDAAGAREAIGSIFPRGNTSLYNGLYMTLKEMMKQRPVDGGLRRQAIVVLSDGNDTSSLVSADDLMDLAKQAGVAIYTITLQQDLEKQRGLANDPRSYKESMFAMKALAQQTGARAFFPASILELSGVYDAIAEELANQYLVGYIPKNLRADASYRRVDVRVERPGIRARTRAGYAAPTSSADGTR
jgi:Ca-activated chloride channel family protein